MSWPRKSANWSSSVLLRFRTWDRVPVCLRSFVEVRLSGLLAKQIFAKCRRQSEPQVKANGLANRSLFSWGTPHSCYFLTRKSSALCIAGVNSRGTFLTLFPLISTLWKCWQSFFSMGERVSFTSSCEFDGFFNKYADRGIFDTSPALRQLNRITCVKEIFDICDYVREDDSVDSLEWICCCWSSK